jgi:3-oxoacyl-[acyl-carrier protein] reductase
MNLGLEGKVALVTAASSGIGRATALAFAAEGAAVAFGYRSNHAAAASAAAIVVAAGGRAIPWQLDLGDAGALPGAVAEARRQLGPIDILVNNAIQWAGFPEPGEWFGSAPVDRFVTSVTTNLIGPYVLARAAVADMCERGWGRIVHVSTGLVEDGLPGSSAYVSAKAGLHGLSRAMSRELAAEGILTNVVMPGFTPAEKPVPSEMLERASAAAATRRVSTPDEAARVIVFLCSEANTSTTGVAVRTDGHFLTAA